MTRDSVCSVFEKLYSILTFYYNKWRVYKDKSVNYSAKFNFNENEETK